MKCWTNAETFDPWYAYQISSDKNLTAEWLKLEAAKRAGYDKGITFEFPIFMSPQSAYLQQGTVWQGIKNIFNINNYEGTFKNQISLCCLVIIVRH